MTDITPVILCGGSGTRLWPLSRQSYPKQFARLGRDETLFQACAARLNSAANGLRFTPPVTVTNSDFRFIVAEQLQAIGIDPGPILIEPEGRNTAPAVLAAALHVAKADPDAVLLIAPSDHLVDDVPAFHAALAEGLTAIAADQGLVTFGITPDRPETGYGYLELACPPDGTTAMPLQGFVEKPDAARAAGMMDSGRYLWNGGIFMFTARAILDAYTAHAPGLIGPVSRAVDAAKADLGFLRLAPGPWAEAADISIDYAVMEKAERLAVVPLDARWSDLGSWEAVLQTSERDGDGVATSGPVTAMGCRDTLLRSEDDGVALVGIGLQNILAIATSDAVLVADMAHAQDIGQAVAALKAKGARQATAFAMDHRPWGYFETLALSDRFQVKRIVVKPGAALSLQSHVHRAEHWVVVAGTAKVTIGDAVKLVSENQSVYIPLGEKHRLENPGKLPIVLIEVQTGAYLGEDDIVRYEDVYARGQGAKG